MKGFRDRINQLLAVLVLLLTVWAASGCASVKVHAGPLPPVLGQDELLRPYETVAAIKVYRHRYGDPDDLPPADYNWAYEALRDEARKVGADAVIYPEINVEVHRYIFFPVSEISGKGIAIRFK